MPESLERFSVWLGSTGWVLEDLVLEGSLVPPSGSRYGARQPLCSTMWRRDLMRTQNTMSDSLFTTYIHGLTLESGNFGKMKYIP